MSANQEFLLPQGFAERMHADLGCQAEELLESLRAAPVTSIRLNPRKPVRLPFDSLERVKWCADGIYLPERPVFALMPEWHAGAFYVQDASSMILKYLSKRAFGILGINNPVVADFCAAPGGKTTAVADEMPDGALLVANEFMPQRAAVLRENVWKWGIAGIVTTCEATSTFAHIGELFDLIIVDAPCSGEGMMRKEKEAASQWNEGLIRQCADLQRSILADAEKALKPGGIIIYSTCTFNREENEHNVAFAVDRLGLQPLDPAIPQEWGIAKQTTGTAPCLRFMPHITKGEGLFVSMLQKPAGTFSNSFSRRRKPEKVTKEFTVPIDKGKWILTEKKSILYASPENHSDMLKMLLQNINNIHPGTPVGTIKGRDIIPTAAGMSAGIYNKGAYPEIELSEDESLSYLRREALKLGAEAEKGYLSLTYKGLPLGPVKNLGTRANNLYPAEWRLRI